MWDILRISSISLSIHKSAIGKYLILTVLLIFVVASCSGSGGSSPPDKGSDTDPWETAKTIKVSILSPEQDASYTQFAPPITVALTSDGQADTSSLKLTLNDEDITDRVTLSDNMASVTGYQPVLTEGQNTLIAEVDGQTSTVTFQFSECADTPCSAAEPPVITGPAQAESLTQTSLKGTGFGSPGDERTLYLNGERLPLTGVASGGDWLVFVPPPQLTGPIEVVLEVNGLKSASFTMNVLAPPELARPVEDTISDYRSSLVNLEERLRSLPNIESDNAEYDGMVADFRGVIEESMDQLIGEFDTLVAGLEPEGQEVIAQFLVQNGIDTQMTRFLQQVDGESLSMATPMAQQTSLLDTSCAASVVSLLTIESYLNLMRDSLMMLEMACLATAALVPPMAMIMVPVLSYIKTNLFFLDSIRLYLSLLSPELGNLSIDLAQTVGRHDTVPVHAQGEFSYAKPSQKVVDVVKFTLTKIHSEAIGESLKALIPKIDGDLFEAFNAYNKVLQKIIKKSITTSMDFSKYILDQLDSSGQTGDPVTIAVDPTLIGFHADYFRLAKGQAVCEAEGFWDDSTPCSVEDSWRIGWSLAYSGFMMIGDNNGKANGTIKTDGGALPQSYDDVFYGVTMENFGAAWGCDAILECYEVIINDDNCSPGLANALCESMTMDGCPTEHDAQLAFDRCSGEGGC
jgi:hypothetical protein